MAVGDSNLAGVARVAFEAQTGEFNRDVSRAEQTYKSATSGMSDAAIKLELANERLRRSLAKGPTAAREQARALLSVRQAERELTQETDRGSRAQQRHQRELAQTTRRATAGAGAFRGLGRQIAFTAGTFLGASGLIYGIKSALDASSNLNEQVSKSRVVFGSSAREVEAWAKNALGLANDQALETAGSIGALLRPLGILEDRSAKISTRLTDLGTDLASFYNTDVQSALDAIRSGLVGEIEPLRRYGVILSATKVEQAAMAATGKTNAKSLTDQEKALARVKIILGQTSLAHGDYARTIGGSANQERELQKNWRNTQILLGQTLQPTYNELLRTINRWLGEQENQERIQRTVNSAVEAGVGTFKAIRGAIDDARAVVEPLVRGLGGIENTLKLIAGVWVAWKAKSVLGFTATAASSRAASVKMIADATAAGRAWDWATRPRTMIVTTTGTGVPTGTPGTPGRTGPTTTTTGRGRLPLPGGIGRVGAVGGLVAFAGVASIVGDIATYKPSLREQQRKVADYANVDPDVARRIAREYNRQLGTSLNSLLLAGNNPFLEKSLIAGGPSPTDIRAPGEGRAPAPSVRRTGPSSGAGTTTAGGAPRRTIADIQLDLARARTTGGTADDERLVRELRDRYRRQAAVFEQRKTLTRTQRATLERLYGEIASAENELEGYEEERENALEAKRKAAQEKRKARAARAAAAEEKRQREFERITQRQREQAAKSARFAKWGWGAAATFAKGNRKFPDTKKSADAEAVMREEMDRALSGLTSGLAQIYAQYAPNVFGQPSMGSALQTTILEGLTREQTEVLRGVASRGRATDDPVLRREAEAVFA